MKRDTSQQVLLQIDADENFVPVVHSFAAETGLALGLGASEAQALTLAAREVFSHLCRVVLKSDERVEISCRNGGYYVVIDFIFAAADMDLNAFNLGAAVCSADGAELEETGLLSASRSVDRFAITRVDDRGLKLRLLKEKGYPQLEESPLALPPPLAEFSVRPPHPEELKLFARLVKACYQGHALPEVFDYPGKLVDMVAGPHYAAAVAVGPAGEIGGGTFWHRGGKREVEWFGPYLFNQKAGSPIAGALLESCIGAIARTEVVVLINRFATPEFPREHFELLGTALMCLNRGECLPREAWFRLLHEDLGSISWVHPELEDFLQGEYDRLVLPREMRHVTSQGEQVGRHSVLSTHFDRSEASATLRPMWFGTDFDQNLTRHLQILHQEGILNVFFYLDVGRPWQAAFTPGLRQHGFQPRLVFPCSGAGDVVVFQLQGAAP